MPRIIDGIDDNRTIRAKLRFFDPTPRFTPITSLYGRNLYQDDTNIANYAGVYSYDADCFFDGYSNTNYILRAASILTSSNQAKLYYWQRASNNTGTSGWVATNITLAPWSSVAASGMFIRAITNDGRIITVQCSGSNYQIAEEFTNYIPPNGRIDALRSGFATIENIGNGRVEVEFYQIISGYVIQNPASRIVLDGILNNLYLRDAPISLFYPVLVNGYPYDRIDQIYVIGGSGYSPGCYILVLYPPLLFPPMKPFPFGSELGISDDPPGIGGSAMPFYLPFDLQPIKHLIPRDEQAGFFFVPASVTNIGGDIYVTGTFYYQLNDKMYFGYLKTNRADLKGSGSSINQYVHFTRMHSHIISDNNALMGTKFAPLVPVYDSIGVCNGVYFLPFRVQAYSFTQSTYELGGNNHPARELSIEPSSIGSSISIEDKENSIRTCTIVLDEDIFAQNLAQKPDIKKETLYVDVSAGYTDQIGLFSLGEFRVFDIESDTSGSGKKVILKCAQDGAYRFYEQTSDGFYEYPSNKTYRVDPDGYGLQSMIFQPVHPSASFKKVLGDGGFKIVPASPNMPEFARKVFYFAPMKLERPFIYYRIGQQGSSQAGYGFALGYQFSVNAEVNFLIIKPNHSQNKIVLIGVTLVGNQYSFKTPIEFTPLNPLGEYFLVQIINGVIYIYSGNYANNTVTYKLCASIVSDGLSHGQKYYGIFADAADESAMPLFKEMSLFDGEANTVGDIITTACATMNIRAKAYSNLNAVVFGTETYTLTKTFWSPFAFDFMSGQRWSVSIYVGNTKIIDYQNDPIKYQTYGTNAKKIEIWGTRHHLSFSRPYRICFGKGYFAVYVYHSLIFWCDYYAAVVSNLSLGITMLLSIEKINPDPAIPAPNVFFYLENDLGALAYDYSIDPHATIAQSLSELLTTYNVHLASGNEFRDLSFYLRDTGGVSLSANARIYNINTKIAQVPGTAVMLSGEKQYLYLSSSNISNHGYKLLPKSSVEHGWRMANIAIARNEALLSSAKSRLFSFLVPMIHNDQVQFSIGKKLKIGNGPDLRIAALSTNIVQDQSNASAVQLVSAYLYPDLKL